MNTDAILREIVDLLGPSREEGVIDGALMVASEGTEQFLVIASEDLDDKRIYALSVTEVRVAT